MARENGSLFVVCSVSRSVVPDSLRPHGLQPTRLFCLWDFPGKDTGVGCHFLLQGIFPTQGSNPGLLHCRRIPYRLSYKGSPFLWAPFGEGARILEWVAIPFSRDLPDPGIEPGSPALQAVALPSEPPVQAAYLPWWLLLSKSMGCRAQAQ